MEFRLQQFSGPLDLLLSLIQEKKMPITDVALSAVTEQYVQYIDSLDESAVEPEELADFLVIAAKLILLKAKSLIPTALDDDEDGGSLEDQLRLYKLFVDAAKLLNKRWLSPDRSFFREEPIKKAEGFIRPTNLYLETMHECMVQLVRRLTPPKPLPKTTIDGSISLEQKIIHLKQLIKKGRRLLFHETVLSSRNKTEIIVGFLALLELVKQQEVAVEQDDLFGDITIVPA